MVRSSQEGEEEQGRVKEAVKVQVAETVDWLTVSQGAGRAKSDKGKAIQGDRDSRGQSSPPGRKHLILKFPRGGPRTEEEGNWATSGAGGAPGCRKEEPRVEGRRGGKKCPAAHPRTVRERVLRGLGSSEAQRKTVLKTTRQRPHG